MILKDRKTQAGISWTHSKTPPGSSEVGSCLPTTGGCAQAHFLRKPQLTDVPTSNPETAECCGVGPGCKEGGRTTFSASAERDRERDSSAGGDYGRLVGTVTGSFPCGWPALGPQTRSHATCLEISVQVQNAGILPALYLREREDLIVDTMLLLKYRAGQGEAPAREVLGCQRHGGSQQQTGRRPGMAGIVSHPPGRTHRTLLCLQKHFPHHCAMSEQKK